MADFIEQLRTYIPTICPICQGDSRGGNLCTPCTQDWQRAYLHVPWRCQRCQAAQFIGAENSNLLCNSCYYAPLLLHQLAVAFDYTLPLDSLIWRFKSRQQLRLAPVLARMMHYAIQRDQWGLPTDTVVAYIPSRAAALRQRGFNPAAELARSMARLLRLPLCHGVFAWVDQHRSDAQKQRSRQQRLAAAHEAFCWQGVSKGKGKGRGAPRALLLVDDVYTTGSTLHGAAYCALQHGVEQVYGVVAARVPEGSYL